MDENTTKKEQDDHPVRCLIRRWRTSWTIRRTWPTCSWGARRACALRAARTGSVGVSTNGEEPRHDDEVLVSQAQDSAPPTPRVRV